MNKTHLIGCTNIGSHMWNMQRPDSDIDLFEVYLASTKDILIGRQPESYCEKRAGEPTKDVAGHELGKVLNMILKGNVNFIWGIYSPLVEFETEIFNELRAIAMNNQSQNIYHSINGLSIHNLNRLKEEGLTEKKTRTILRTIDFGINYLNGNGAIFNKCDEKLPSDYKSTLYYINSKLDELKMAKDHSQLPESPSNFNIELAEAWLVGIRMEEIYDKENRMRH